MNKSRWGFLAAAVLAASAAAQARPWTATSGKTIEADFVKVAGDTVHLKKEDGAPLMIRLALLSAEDQAYVKQRAADAAEAQMPAAAQPSRSVNAATLLSEKDLARLTQNWTDPKTGESYRFSASMSLDPKSKKNLTWKEGQPLEIKISAENYKTSKAAANGKLGVPKRDSGTALFYVLDDQQKPLFTKVKSLDSMCPT